MLNTEEQQVVVDHNQINDANAIVDHADGQNGQEELNFSVTDDENHTETDATDELNDETEEGDEPDLTDGVKKRIAKLKAKADREKAELRAEFDTKLEQLQRSFMQTQSQPAMTDANMYAQYQQSYGQQQFHPGFDPNQPIPTFEQFKQWQQQIEIEKKQQEEVQAFQSGLNKVIQETRAQRYQDPDFAKLADTYGGLFNEHMLYALKDTKNPAKFIKSVLKDDKNRAALQQLQSKSPLEQATTISHWSTKFDTLSNARKNVVQKPKPIPQAIGGGSLQARTKPGLDPNNPTTWSKENIAKFMHGR